MRFAGGDIYVKDLYEKADEAAKFVGSWQGIYFVSGLLFLMLTTLLLGVAHSHRLVTAEGVYAISMTVIAIMVVAIPAIVSYKFHNKALELYPDLSKIRNWPEFLRLVRR